MTHDLRLARWAPELRSAVERVKPAFFTWPAEQQTRWRVALPDDDHTAIVKLLLDAIRPAGAEPPAPPDDEDRLPLDLQNRINELMLPLTGLGVDAFHLNEHLAEGVSILNFPTLRAYDEDDHWFQEEARAAENPGHLKQPYLGTLSGGWARVLVDGRLTYLTLSMAAAYIGDVIDEAATDELQRRIPHSYVPGPDDGKVERNGTIWDKRLAAGGQEAVLDELQRRVWQHERERALALSSDYAALGLAGVYLDERPYPYEPPDERHLQWVFTDTAALDRVHFDTFMSDCRSMQRPLAELEAAAAIEVERVLSFIAEQHQELLRQFSPHDKP